MKKIKYKKRLDNTRVFVICYEFFRLRFYPVLRLLSPLTPFSLTLFYLIPFSFLLCPLTTPLLSTLLITPTLLPTSFRCSLWNSTVPSPTLQHKPIPKEDAAVAVCHSVQFVQAYITNKKESNTLNLYPLNIFFLLFYKRFTK